MDILFFSRGRGRGHATRDLAIARELRALDSSMSIEFASYDMGAQILREAGEIVHDLELPERNAFPTTVVRCAKIIAKIRPRLTVAQEEPAVCVAAAIYGMRVIFTTHWFPLKQRENTSALEYADRVLFMEEPHLFEEPYQVRGRVQYCGPVLRTFRRLPGAAAATRSRLGLDAGDRFLLVLPGSPSEEREPIFDLVSAAVSQLKKPPKLVLWVAGRDYLDLSQRAKGLSATCVVESFTDVDQLIVASDAVVTKGTYNIGREVMALGKPSVSLSHRYNWVDDLFASQWVSNNWVAATEVTSAMLAATLEAALEKTHAYAPNEALLHSPGARIVATELLGELNNV